MSVLKITPPDMNDGFSSVVLSRENYLLRFTYNDTFGFWSFGLYNPFQEPIVASLKILPNIPINIFAVTGDTPPGFFVVRTRLERIGRDDFLNGKAEFLYIFGGVT